MDKRIIKADDGVELAVFETGPADGNCIILCHGLLTNHHTWDSLIEILSEKYRVIAYDQRGHGESGAKDGKNCSVEQIGRDLSAVVHATNSGKKALIIGHSMGGMTIGSWANQYPTEIEKYACGIVLCNTAFFDTIKGTRIFGFSLPNWKILKNLSGLIGAFPVKDTKIYRAAIRRYHFGEPISEEKLGIIVANSLQTSSRAIKKFLPSINNMDLREAIPKIVVPATIITADHDTITLSFLGNAIAEKFHEDGRLRALVEITDSGHLIMVNQPEQFHIAIFSAINDAFV